MLSGGHATNALPQLAEANINCRIYPTDSPEQVRSALASAIGDTTVKVLIKSQRPPSPPAKMSPEILQPVVLSRGNGFLEGTSFVANVIGTACGGLLYGVFRPKTAAVAEARSD